MGRRIKGGKRKNRLVGAIISVAATLIKRNNQYYDVFGCTG